MTLRAGAAGLVSRLRHPRSTVRWRLTLLYGGLFLASGIALLAITYTLVDHASVTPPGFHFVTRAVPGPLPSGFRPGPSVRAAQVLVRRTDAPLATIPPVISKVLRSRAGQATASFVSFGQRIADLHQLVIESIIALTIMTAISAALGWIVAGRVLRPLRTITAAAREISATSLHKRLALDGPNDELRELGSTFDGLLGRLEASFDAQRQFVANASHELRTPLTRQRTIAEVVLSDPAATIQSLRESHERVLAAGEQQERLIDALLTLAHSERGLAHREPFDLAALAGSVVATRQAELEQRELQLEATLDPARVSGEPRLAERLIANLLDNAIRHNHPNGSIAVATEAGGGQVRITITNSGPVIPAGDVDRLLEPFQRLDGARTANGAGAGLGLSIAAAIARAHGGTLEVRPRPGGGLIVEASFPG